MGTPKKVPLILEIPILILKNPALHFKLATLTLRAQTLSPKPRPDLLVLSRDEGNIIPT